MKTLLHLAFAMAWLNCFQSASAQNKPANLFANYKATINVPKTEIEKVFLQHAGNAIQLAFADNSIFTGTVTSSLQHYPNLKSAVIKLSNFDGALFSISERKNDDNTITYVGRIINERYDDAYVLKKDADGQYFLSKIKLNDLLQDR